MAQLLSSVCTDTPFKIQAHSSSSSSSAALSPLCRRISCPRTENTFRRCGSRKRRQRNFSVQASGAESDSRDDTGDDYYSVLGLVRFRKMFGFFNVRVQFFNFAFTINWNVMFDCFFQLSLFV